MDYYNNYSQILEVDENDSNSSSKSRVKKYFFRSQTKNADIGEKIQKIPKVSSKKNMFRHQLSVDPSKNRIRKAVSIIKKDKDEKDIDKNSIHHLTAKFNKKLLKQKSEIVPSKNIHSQTFKDTSSHLSGSPLFENIRGLNSNSNVSKVSNFSSSYNPESRKNPSFKKFKSLNLKRFEEDEKLFTSLFDKIEDKPHKNKVERTTSVNPSKAFHNKLTLNNNIYDKDSEKDRLQIDNFFNSNSIIDRKQNIVRSMLSLKNLDNTCLVNNKKSKKKISDFENKYPLCPDNSFPFEK